MEKENISAAEILGSVRASLKHYKAFEHLAKVVAFLEQQDVYEKKLNQQIGHLESELSDLQLALNQKSQVLADTEAKIVEAKAELKSVIENREATERAIVDEAKKKADDIIDQAKIEEASITKTIDALRQQRKIEEDETARISAERHAMQSKYESEKKRIIESLK